MANRDAGTASHALLGAPSSYEPFQVRRVLARQLDAPGASSSHSGAYLAGGHGLGYDDEFICGNIVKCRWALSDCEFCREMLEQLHQQTGEAEYARLVEDSRKLADAVRDRIARLRKRVWWSSH